MKWKMISIFAVFIITLMACQAGDNGDNTSRGTDNPNIDPTTVRNQAGDGGTANNPNYTLQRDADRFQNRDGRNNRMNNERNTSRYDIAEEAAERITDEVDHIERAFVLTTDNNAYVAAQLDEDNHTNNNNNNRNMNQTNNRNNNGDLTDQVKDKIADIVQSVDRNIENVYVSTNPDFLNLANDYADDVDSGEPIEGFFDQIGTMVERLFPDNRNNQNNN